MSAVAGVVEHEATSATGVMLPDPQRFAIGFIVAVGGFFMVMVWEDDVVPHEFIVVSVMLYVPGSVKLKFALLEL